MVKRQLAGGVILCLALAAPLAISAPTTVVIGTPPQPTWSTLGPEQKLILSPLSTDWDKMENIRRKKWLGIAERYPNMKPDEQNRVQERMREWANLTPEQRTKVRDTYKEFNQLPQEQKQTVKQKWEAYSNLPADEKQRVREGGKSSKLLPLPETGQPANPPETGSLPVAPESSSDTTKR